jgi:hypothetical protein
LFQFSEEDSNDIFTPEVYVAEIPEAGIPALTESGGTYTPGEASCNIFKLDSSGNLTDASFDKDVHNLNDASLDRSGDSKFCLTSRDKFGKWYVPVPRGTGTSTSTNVWYRSQEAWRTNGTDPRIKCRRVTGTPGRTSSSTDASDVWIYLPRVRSGDPNVIGGVNLLAAQDSDSNWTCLSDYMDDKIGTVKMWVKTKAEIPSGWKLMDGIENVVPNGGTGISFLVGDGYDFGFPRFTNNDLAIGTSGGAETTTIGVHDTADVAAAIADHGATTTAVVLGHTHTAMSGGGHNHTGSSASSDGAHSHTGTTGSDGVHDHTGLTTSSGSHSHGGATGSDGTGSTGSTSISATASAETVGINDPGHQHGLGYITIEVTENGTAVGDGNTSTDPNTTGITAQSHSHTISDVSGHTHTGPSHTHTISTFAAHDHQIYSQAAHTHTISNHLAHTHTITVASESGHTHTTDTQGGHSHATPALGHSGVSGTHHDLAHDTIDILPPYLFLMFIERVNNSAGA